MPVFITFTSHGGGKSKWEIEIRAQHSLVFPFFPTVVCGTFFPLKLRHIHFNIFNFIFPIRALFFEVGQRSTKINPITFELRRILLLKVHKMLLDYYKRFWCIFQWIKNGLKYFSEKYFLKINNIYLLSAWKSLRSFCNFNLIFW